MPNIINKVAIIGTGVIGAGWIIRCLAHNKKVCLLYTSDAADDTPCVDLGGRRIIKKKIGF